jgi:hypothetical protein
VRARAGVDSADRVAGRGVCIFGHLRRGNFFFLQGPVVPAVAGLIFFSSFCVLLVVAGRINFGAPCPRSLDSFRGLLLCCSGLCDPDAVAGDSRLRFFCVPYRRSS